MSSLTLYQLVQAADGGLIDEAHQSYHMGGRIFAMMLSCHPMNLRHGHGLRYNGVLLEFRVDVLNDASHLHVKDS